MEKGFCTECENFRGELNHKVAVCNKRYYCPVTGALLLSNCHERNKDYKCQDYKKTKKNNLIV